MRSTAGSYRLLLADVYELAGVSRRFSGRAAATLDTTVAQWHVLSVVSEAPASVPAIAARLGMTRQGAQRVVNELAAASRVRAAANPDHARSPLIGSTPRGAQLLEQLWATSTPSRERVLSGAGITGRELEQTRATLGRLLEALRQEDAARDHDISRRAVRA